MWGAEMGANERGVWAPAVDGRVDVLSKRESAGESAFGRCLPKNDIVFMDCVL